MIHAVCDVLSGILLIFVAIFALGAVFLNVFDKPNEQSEEGINEEKP